MKNLKRYVSVICLVSLLMSCFALPAMAAPVGEQRMTIDEIANTYSSNAVYTNTLNLDTGEGDLVQVLIADELLGTVTYGDIYDIVIENELSDGDVIEINETGLLENSCLADSTEEVLYLNSDGSIAEPETPQSRWKWYDLILNIKSTWWYGSEYVAKDVFIASAARGEVYTLTKKFKSSLSLSLEAGATYSNITGKIASTSTVSYEVEKSHKYTGPSESSSYNSVEFRVKFYAKKCYVTQAVTGNISDHTSYYYATYVVPTRYLSYSIYHKV